MAAILQSNDGIVHPSATAHSGENQSGENRDGNSDGNLPSRAILQIATLRGLSSISNSCFALTAASCAILSLGFSSAIRLDSNQIAVCIADRCELTI